MFLGQQTRWGQWLWPSHSGRDAVNSASYEINGLLSPAGGEAKSPATKQLASLTTPINSWHLTPDYRCLGPLLVYQLIGLLHTCQVKSNSSSKGQGPSAGTLQPLVSAHLSMG